MKILITNDDGISAPGLRALADAAAVHGEVTIVAPDRERSACAHGMTMREPLRLIDVEGFEAGGRPVRAWACSGLPADCVNLAIRVAYEDQKPDLVLSGMNSGPNLGFDTTYSGTVAGAMEGCAYGIPSIAVSLASMVTGAPFHWEAASQWFAENLPRLLAFDPPFRTFLNVNIPAVPESEIRGMRVAALAERIYEERVDFREDPWGRPYYWQGGVAVLAGDQPGTDVQAVREGFTSVSPVMLDWTHHGALRTLADALDVEMQLG